METFSVSVESGVRRLQRTTLMLSARQKILEFASHQRYHIGRYIEELVSFKTQFNQAQFTNMVRMRNTMKDAGNDSIRAV